MTTWAGAAAAVVVGLLLGALTARIAQGRMERSRTPALVQVAPAVGVLAFSTFVIAGLITALGFVDPDSLSELPSDIVRAVPDLLLAAIIVIGGNIAGTLAAAAVSGAVVGLRGAARFFPSMVKWAVVSASIVLAAAQIGVDTDLVLLSIGALLFTFALGSALLIGLGGRQVAGNVAAARAWREHLRPGDEIEIEDVVGTVVEVHPAVVEIEVLDVHGTRQVFVPASLMLGMIVRSRRPQPGLGAAEPGGAAPPDRRS